MTPLTLVSLRILDDWLLSYLLIGWYAVSYGISCPESPTHFVLQINASGDSERERKYGVVGTTMG
jgi:hypothetical protein